MNIIELIITSVLAVFDRFMDRITRATWTRVRESEIPNIVKINKG